MTDTNDTELPEKKGEPQDITRREALVKLAKYSAYTAPTVMTLLASRPSMAQLSSVNQCTGINNAPGDPDPPPVTGEPFDGIETGNHPADDNVAGNRPPTTGSGTGVNWDSSTDPDNIETNDTTIDCGR